MHRVVATRAKPIQNSVASYHGTCTMRFSQCEPPLATFIAREPAVAYGTCEALSTYWIREHAAGRSLFTWLYAGFEKSGNAARGVGMRMGRLTNVMSLQVEEGAEPDAGVHPGRDTASEEWLVAHANDVRRIYSSRDAMRIPGLRVMGDKALLGGTGETRVFTSQALASAICDSAGHDAGRYLKSGIEGTAGGHSMAAYVAGDVCFFDPNFGEFWFESHQMFKSWFTGYFWHASMYSVGLSGSYSVRSYSGRA
ncbi:MAG: hypothetical protein JRG76_04250 [Deltaproteobacteria bacterium]|nr:hypothetical protein [Deltaproteobacteria bacterium]MBW2413701.1 hypothetical protein [Deltaproteobacteria bacterium]